MIARQPAIGSRTGCSFEGRPSAGRFEQVIA
jgi:hypothetical protein